MEIVELKLELEIISGYNIDGDDENPTRGTYTSCAKPIKSCLPVGNLHNNTFIDIWKNSNDLKNIIKINLKGNTNEDCKKCKYKEFCQYCFGKNFQSTGDPCKLSIEQCNLARQEYEIWKNKNN